MSVERADLNVDFGRPARVLTPACAWQESPSGTVWRKPLYRQGGEFGPVTSLVRYAPGGAYSAHPHPEGEEIFVLSGVFSDDSGDFPAGSWLFNPEGFSHAPHSESGCDLLVRLRQYPGERRRRCVDTTSTAWLQTTTEGLWIKLLYREVNYPEYVCLIKLDPGSVLPVQRFEGLLEYFVLEGTLCLDETCHEAGTWVRLPSGLAHVPSAPDECLVYVRAERQSGSVFECNELN